MKGDFSRPTFDPKKGYSGVLMQQGRVLLDADWNEQGAIVRNRIETETRDVIGGCGGPKAGAGFEVYTWTIIARPQPGPVYDAFEDIPSESKAADVQSSGPATAASGKAGGVNPGPDPGPFFDLRPRITAGRYYVDGILVVSEYNGLLVDQPHLPLLPNTKLFDAAGRYLAYLDVWDRHITVLDDPTMRETALGGPDTTTRSKTIWQVKVVNVGSDATLGCGSSIPAYDAATAKPTGKMTARTAPALADQGPCIVSPGAGYLGLENQLYRVEVHGSGMARNTAGTPPVTAATFKWSRDNAATVTTIETIKNETINGVTVAKITVHDVGPDSVLGFAQGQWAELTDDVLELNGLPGQLIQIASVDPATRVITLVSAATVLAADTVAFPNGVDPERHPKLRRWDGQGAVTFSGATPDIDYLKLEAGIEIGFTPGTYRTGDYWTIPARTATADVASGNIEWPVQADGTTARLPFGIEHHYCRIAMLMVNGSGDVREINDCRCLFPALNDIEGFFYVGGDGQEVMPGGVMPQPLQVGVFKVGMSNNCVPVRGALVQFRTPDGGTLGLDADETKGAEATPAYNVATDPNGVATIYWRPNPNPGPNGENLSQTVTARLITEDGLQTQTVVFNGQLSVASEVAYKPGTCSTLKDADTVQEALDILCSKLGDCHDFLDELRSDGVVRDGEGVLGLNVTAANNVAAEGELPFVSYTAGIVYVTGCRRVVPAGNVSVEWSMLGQWVVVNSTGDIEVLLEPVPPRDYALLALVSTFAGKVERIVDWRRDMTHLDEQVEENRHGVATTRKDARQYVPLLAGTIRDLRYRNDIGDFGYRDGRNHTYDAPSPVGGLVFDGRAMWAPTADKNGAPRLMRIERYATENDPDAFIPVDRSLKSGAFDGGRVWYTAQNIGDDGMGSLLAIDVETHTIHSLLVPGRPQAIMFDGHFLWVTTDAATIHQIDVDRNQIVRTLALPVIPGVPTLQPLALEFDGEDIWVSATLRTLFRIQKPWGDPESVSVHQSTQDFIKLAYDGSHLWTLSLNGRLGKLDVLSHASRFLALPTNELVTGELLFDGAYVWAMVTDSELNPAMYRYDPRIDQISDSVPLPRTVDPGWRAPWPTTLNSLRLHAFDGTHLWYPFYAGVIDGERKYGVQKFLVA